VFCKKCGKEINEDAVYCKYCGNSIIKENKDVCKKEPSAGIANGVFKFHFRKWYVKKKRQLINKYKGITSKQRNVFLLLFLILMLSIGVGVYLAVPKISDVESLRAKEDSIGLCILVENNSKTNRYTPVVISATRAILEINDTDAISRLTNVVANGENNVGVRIAIVEQFAEKNMIIPDMFKFISDKDFNSEVRQAIISATNRVNSNFFKEKVETELEAAKKITHIDDFIDAIINVRTFDVNGEKSDRINTVLYSAYISRINQIEYNSGHDEIKKTLNEMEQVDSIISAKDKAIIQSLKRYISNDEEFYKKIDQINEREQQAKIGIQKAKARINAINSYLANCGLIRAYIIDSIGNDTYEISFNLGGVNDRAVLKTNGTSFTTKGWFEMFAKRMGNRPISLLTGQTTEWPYFEEDVEAQKKVSELEIVRLALYDSENKIYETNNERALLNSKRINNKVNFRQLVSQLGHKG